LFILPHPEGGVNLDKTSSLPVLIGFGGRSMKLIVMAQLLGADRFLAKLLPKKPFEFNGLY
jgi:hypothetical protein